MANGNQLPEGFVLDQPTNQAALPAGFVLDAPQQPAPRETQQAETGFFDEVGAQISKSAQRKIGGLEAAGTVASGILAEPVSGIAGLVGAAFPGEEGQGARVAQATREALTFTPQTEAGEQILGELGTAVQEGVDIAQVPLSGIGGIIELISGQGIDQAVETLKGIKEQGVSKQLGERTFEETGSPLAASLAEGAPSAALEAAGLGTIRKAQKAGDVAQVVAKADRRAADVADINRVKESLDIQKKTVDAVQSSKPVTVEARNIGGVKTGEIPEVRDYQEILTNLKNKKAKNAAIDAMPDDEILKAADDLGVDLNPDHYSSNQVFREVTQSLKSRPGSTLGAKEQAAIQTLGQRADELIADIGGQTDRSLLDQGLKSDIDNTIARLQSKSDKAYKTVDAVIPKTVKVKPNSSRAYINSTLDELGGDKASLSAAEKKLLSVMDKNPTYAAIDRLRKDVGDGFRKNAGPYKDDNPGTLKQVYRAISEDQQGVADIYGVGDDYASARKLVQSRKQIEDNAVTLFGRDAEGSIVPKMKSAATKLTQGDLSEFNRLMKAVPSNRQAEVAATMLNNLFTQGARTQGQLGQGFVKAFEGLNKNRGAKNILFSKLPKDARRRFDNLGKVSTGLFRSKGLENTSKTARDVISAMDDGGMFNKLLNIGEKLTPVPGTGSSVVGGISAVLNKSKASQVADEFITSPKFRRAIEVAAKNNKPKSADAILRNSKEFKAWRDMLSDTDKQLLTRQGFISFITSQEDNQ